MNPVSVQVNRQMPADEGNFHLIPLAGLFSHAVQRNHRAGYRTCAVQIGKLAGIIVESNFQSREGRIALFSGTEQGCRLRRRR